MTWNLQIGGHVRQPGWLNLDALVRPEVDVIGRLGEPLPFGDGVFAQVYASHVVEHLSFTGELQRALREIRRVLQQGGLFKVAVPDLDILGPLIARPDLSIDEQLQVMAMIHGGQGDAFDLHKVGFNRSILSFYLIEAGFSDAFRVEDFGDFADCSTLTFRDQPISLNLIVT